MNKLKSIFSPILESVLFALLGGIFVFVSLYLHHYFTFDPPSGIDIHIIPLYRFVSFPLLIILLSISFLFGKVIFRLFKQQYLQWFYNIIFLIIAGIGVDLYVIYQHIKEFGGQLNIETFDQLGSFYFLAVMFLLLLLYSFLYQIIKTRIFSKSNKL